METPKPRPPQEPIDDIEVTTATQSAEEVEARLAADANGDEQPVVPAKPAKPAAGDKPPVQAAAAEGDELSAEDLAALDELEPPPAEVQAGTVKETAQQTTARRTRAQKRVLKEISKRKQSDDRAAALVTENATLRAQLEARQSGDKPPAPKPGDRGTAGAETTATTEKKFDFPSWEKWQTEHPDAEYSEYVDARTDARFAFREEVSQATAAQRENQKAADAAFTTVKTAEADFKAKTPDYDAVVSTVKMMGTQSTDGKFIPSGGTIALQQELLRLGADAPKVNYYLGKNPKVAEALMSAASPREFLVLFGQTMLRATGEVAPVVAAGDDVKPPKPAKPATRAPVPLEPVRGTQSHERSLKEISEEDGEDADGYIARRQTEMR